MVTEEWGAALSEMWNAAIMLGRWSGAAGDGTRDSTEIYALANSGLGLSTEVMVEAAEKMRKATARLKTIADLRAADSLRVMEAEAGQ